MGTSLILDSASPLSPITESPPQPFTISDSDDEQDDYTSAESESGDELEAQGAMVMSELDDSATETETEDEGSSPLPSPYQLDPMQLQSHAGGIVEDDEGITPTVSQPVFTPSTSPSRTTLASSSTPASTLASTLTPVPSSTSLASRRVLSLPQFLKRNSSAKSIPQAVKVGQQNDSDSGDVARDGESESASAGASHRTKGRPIKDRMKRFSRKKAAQLEGEGAVPEEKRKRGLRRRVASAPLTEGLAGQQKLEKKSGLKRKKSKPAYRLDEESTSVGLVQIEIKSAASLPRIKSLSRFTFDMDAFAVVSLGKAVARTRVIRHSLNPVWNEKISFQIGRAEFDAGYNVLFNIFDWDKLTSNDHVGDTELNLRELIEQGIQPDERGLYPATPEGKIAGDDFHDKTLRIMRPEKAGQGNVQENAGEDGPTLFIRAKFTPYGEL